MEEGPEVGRREDIQKTEPMEEEPSPTFEPLEEPSPTGEPWEEEREEAPAPGGPQNADHYEFYWNEPLGSVLDNLIEMEEEGERKRTTERELVREQGKDLELMRPPLPVLWALPNCPIIPSLTTWEVLR